MKKSDLGAKNGDSQIIPLLIAWGVILIPLAWGVQQTVLKALALFR